MGGCLCGQVFPRDTKEGPNNDYLVDNKIKPEESVVLNDVHKFFLKYSTTNCDSKVVIPKDEFDTMRNKIEVTLRRQTVKENEILIQEPALKENPKISIVYILNTSNNRPAKSFSDKLRDILCQMCFNVEMITASGVLDIDTENVLMIICNKVEGDTPQQAVDRCLDSIKEDHYASMILIMLHVTRKPPLTRTQRHLLSSDKYKRIGKIVDMAFDSKNGIYACKKNEEAFSEILNFVCDYNSTHTRTQLAAEKSKIGTSETCASNASNADLQYCSDIPKPTAYIMETTHSEASSNFVCEFQKKMKTQNIILKSIPDCHGSKFDPDIFLILVCTITLRLEADVDKCLSAISRKQYSRTILIVLHVSNKSDSRSNSRRNLLEAGSKEYEGLFQIIDMAFSNDKGIYHCKMNKDAFQELEKIYVRHKNNVTAKTLLNENETSNDDTNDTENINDLQLNELTTEGILNPEEIIKTDNLENKDQVAETSV